MPIVLVEGFDLYSAISGDTGGSAENSGWVASSTNTKFGIGTGRFSGSRSARTTEDNTSQTWIRRELPSALGALTVGFALHTDALPHGSSVELFQLEDSSNNPQLTLAINGGTRQLEVWRGNTSSGTLLATASTTIVATTWFYVELAVDIDNSGSVKLYIDGGSSPEIDESGVDTQEQSESTASYIRFIGDEGGTITSDVDTRFDDLYITDGADAADRLGESRVTTLYPNADTADADWSPSSGSDNFAMVDEDQADGDTSFVSTDTLNAKDLYDLDNLTIVPDNIHAVQVNVQGRKNDAGSRGITAIMKSGAVENSGTEKSMNAASYQPARVLSETDPDGGGAWTRAAINALKAGMELTT